MTSDRAASIRDYLEFRFPGSSDAVLEICAPPAAAAQVAAPVPVPVPVPVPAHEAAAKRARVDKRAAGPSPALARQPHAAAGGGASTPPPPPPPAPAPAAAAAAAAAAAGSLTLTLQRTGQTFSSLPPLLKALHSGDVVTVKGELRGPLDITKPGVTFTGRSDEDRFTLLAPAGNQSTLILGADGCIVRYANIYAVGSVTQKLVPTVVVVEKLKGCSLDHCHIKGTGEPKIRSACAHASPSAVLCAA